MFTVCDVLHETKRRTQANSECAALVIFNDQYF